MSVSIDQHYMTEHAIAIGDKIVDAHKDGVISPHHSYEQWHDSICTVQDVKTANEQQDG